MLTSVIAALTLLGSGPSHVALKHTGDAWSLTVDGTPFTIKGAGGDGSKPLLVEVGGNSYRTWGAENLDAKLNEAQRLGLKVTVGIWLGHKEHGFHYDNAEMVAKQFNQTKAVVEKYKDHPAILMWALGNEMEGYDQGDDPAVWTAVEDLAHMVKTVDPNHPTMTVIAEIGGKKVPSIEQMCPSIDIIGINSYAGAPSIYDRYVKQGGKKPYVITEFGPPGTWEAKQTPWKAPIELSSTEKEDWYSRAYKSNVVDHPDLCLGGYAFTWGNKQEATATWFGMLLPDGDKLGAVDAMQKIWTGKTPAHPCPRISKLDLKGDAAVDAGTTITVSLEASDPGGDPVSVHWSLTSDSGVKGLNGDKEDMPDAVPGAVTHSDATGATVRMPDIPGSYRLYAVVKNAHKGAAVANIPLRVRGVPGVPLGAKTTLPLKIYSESDQKLPYVPSGWMGNNAAMKLELDDETTPHSGATCIRWDYNANDGWGSIAWQSPEGNWGDDAGGFDLTGAKKLVLYARGLKGGEKLTFSLGLIKPPKKFFDTAVVAGKQVVLTTEWTRYELDISGVDLTRVMTGLVLTTVAQGKPQSIFLDDITVE